MTTVPTIFSVLLFFVTDAFINIAQSYLSPMSQSILQNGYAILLANTSDIDRMLIAKDQLLETILTIKTRKTAERDDAVQSRRDQIKSLNTAISKLQRLNSDQSTISTYENLKAQLEAQIAQLGGMSTVATYDDVRRTHAFFVNRTFRPIVSVAYGYSNANVTPLPLFGSSTKIAVPIYGDFIADQALHIRLSGLKAVHQDNRVRWFDFLGHRLIKEVRLTIDGVVLDRYGMEEMENYYRFHVSENQKNGWKRCVGQEVPRVATLFQDPRKQEAREQKYICDGLQTPKREHGDVELFIPLLFWFNLDPAFAISNWNITYDKFFVEVEFSDIKDCVDVIDYAGDGGKFVEPTINLCDLITNHVYTIPEVSELFKHRTQFTIVRTHRRVDRILNESFGMVNIGDIKTAVESLYVRFRPRENETGDNRAETWRLNSIANYRELNYATIITQTGVPVLAYTPAYYYESTPAVDEISLVSNGSTIYDANSGTFYESYIPLRYGGERIMTPSDDGSFLMTFSISPGEAQPSGYLNFSQSRDQYINYSSSYAGVDNPVLMSVCATCINFLVTSNGSMSLRYTN